MKVKMSQSTPLDSIETAEVSANTDANLVKKIISEINGGGVQQQQQMQHQPPSATRQMLPDYSGSSMTIDDGPNPNSTMQHHMDPMPQNAHRIGEDYPSYSIDQIMGSGSSGSGGGGTSFQMPTPPKKDVWSYVAERIRAPIVVAALFFLLNLPIFRSSLLQVAPWAFQMGGELSLVGLLLLSMMASLLFAGYQLISDIIGF